MKIFLLIIITILSIAITSYGNDSNELHGAESFEEFFSTNEGEEGQGDDVNSNALQHIIPENQPQDQDIVVYNKAKIIALNKITAKSKIIILNLKEPQYFGNIEITLHRCVKKTDPYAPDNLALLSVLENKPDEDPFLLFQGWMFASSIAASTFEHPIYEIFIKDCL